VIAVALLAPLAYLVGTFPSAVIVARARGIDITQQGSGNPGASNVIRVLGWKVGAVVLLADFAKGAIAGGVGLAVADRPGAYALGIAAVIGHTFPMLRKGGKGVAAAGGMLVVLFPLLVVGLAAVWGIIAKGLRKASVASLLIVIAFPAAVGLLGHAWWETTILSVIAALLVVRHAGNIRRLIRHEEHDLVGGSSKPGRHAA
jgi:acyl phosphate:glycerol-3-phosphate acyltransferase